MNNWYFDRDRGFKLAIFSMVILFVFYPVFAIADSIAINNVLSNKYPFYANEHGKYYEGYDRHSIALRAFEDEKAKNNGVVYCMPSRSCQFKKITSVSDVGIFNNVRVDYVGIFISGLGEGSEGAGFYTVSVLKNDDYHESEDDKRKACLARPVQKGTYDNVYKIGNDYYVNIEGCQYIATGTIVPIGNTVAADWKNTGKVIEEGVGQGSGENGGI